MMKDHVTSDNYSETSPLLLSFHNVIHRHITLFSAVGLIIGVITGSGIFVTPVKVLSGAGMQPLLALLMWFICGLVSVLGALCYVELGLSFPQAGGDYLYIREAFGDLASFIVLWANVIIKRPSLCCITALTFATYAVEPFRIVCPSENCDLATRFLAAVCIALLTFINCWSVKIAMKIQDVFTVAKLLSLVIIIIVGIWEALQGHVENFDDPLTSDINIGGVSLALYSGLFSYGGWNYLNYVTEELQSPEKNLPRAIWIALPLVTIIYVLVNAAYFTVISPNDMLASPAVAMTFGSKVFGRFDWIMSVFVALSTFGGVNGILFTSGRLFHAGAKEGHLPTLFSYIHYKSCIPLPAILVSGIISIFMLITSDIYILINYFSFVLWFTIAVCVAGMLYLRWTHPKINRPIKLHIIFPIFFLLCCVFLVVVPAIVEPFETGIGALITLSGVPVYFLFVKYRSKLPQYFDSFMDKLNVSCQKLLLVMDPETKLS